MFKIFTDQEEVEINLDEINKHDDKLPEIIQSWYSVIPGKEDTKQQPTWFTKGEILTGGKKLKNIKAYGIEKYWEENLFLEKFRNTALLKLLVFALNKK